MNRVYQVVWSDEVGAWVVVSELASRKRRSASARKAPPRTLRRWMLATALCLGPVAGAHAQSLFWDGNDTTANADGGNGTWQNGSTNWDSLATGGANTAWSNAIPNDAVFGGAAGAVTIAAGGVTAHNLTFNVTGYTLSGGTLTLGGTTPTISTATSSIISSVIAGTSGISKTGAGVLQLNGANTYTGVTQVQQGILRLNNAQALGLAGTAAANLVVSPNAEVDFTGATYANNLTATGGTIAIGGTGTWSGAPTITASTTLSVSGITQTGAWSDTGANILGTRVTAGAIFSGANTYSGATQINSGALTLNSAGALSSNSNLQINGTAIAGQWSAVAGLTTANGNFTRALGTGANQVQWTGSGGFASASAGTQSVNIGGAGAALTWGTTPNFVATGNQLMLGTSGTGTLDFQNALVLPNAGTNYNLAAYGGVVGGTNARAKISGVVSGAGNLRIGGNVAGAATGLLELSGANTYTGNLALAGGNNYGNVLLNNASAASTAGGIDIAGPASATGDTLSLTAASGDFTRSLGTGANQVQWTGNGGFSATGGNRFVNLGGAGATVTWGAGNFVPTASWLNLAAVSGGDSEIDFRNPINLNGAVHTVNVGTGGTARLSGVISSAGGVTYQGGGQLTVSGANTYTGITTIANANVVATTIGNGGVAGNLGAANNAAGNLVFNTGTLTYAGAGETSDRNFTVGTSNATLFGSGTGALSLSGATAAAGAHTLTLRGTSNASLVKQGAGELHLARDETFDDTEILGGTLTIDAGHALASRHTQLAAGSTLRIDGAFTGTAGDDTFDSVGTIHGGLAFGTGNDAVLFHGGDLTQLTALDGGMGTDTVTFDAMQIDGASLAPMQSFERMKLQSGSTLALAQALPLSGGVLSIDATSTLRSMQGAQIAGSLENAGTVRIDGGRLAIAGDYTGSGNAALQLVVSPGTGSAGGIDIGGDVRGTTRIAFETDGSVVTQPTRIKVIDSPHDVAGEGTFVATRSGEGFVRLPGSVLNWGFAQDATDKDWYLRTEAFGEQQLGLLPEVPGYGILPTTTLLSARSAGQRAFDHLGSMRDQVDRCGHKDDKPAQNQRQFDDCNGAWASVSAEEVDVGANPGAAFNGDNLAMFMGVDLVGRDAGADAFNGGVFVGMQRGDYWTNGANSSPIAAVAASNVRTETHVFGAYGSRDWQSGWHLDATAIGQLNEGTVKATDGFSQDVVGESFGAHVRTGRVFAHASGWRFDPQLTLGAIDLHWRDVVDGSGKVLQLGDDVVGTARAELRAERDFDTAGGTHWQPWVVAGLEDTFGENAEAMTVLQHDGTAQHFPNHASGLAATLDLGIELKTSAKLSWFGSVAWGHAMDGTDIDRAQATLGARLQW